MEGRNNKSLGNLVAVGLTIASIALIGKLTIGKPEPVTLDITPKLGNQLEMPQASVDGQRGTMLKVYDRDNSRHVLFYDWGFDGRLNQIGVHGGGRGRYTTHNQKEIEKWAPAYNEIRQRLSGKQFEPVFDHFVKRDHVSYVNKLEEEVAK